MNLQLVQGKTRQLMGTLLNDPRMRGRIFSDLVSMVEEKEQDIQKIENELKIQIEQRFEEIFSIVQGALPQKGLDYFTEEEKEDLITSILGQLPIPKITEEEKDTVVQNVLSVLDPKVESLVQRYVKQIEIPEPPKVDEDGLIARILKKIPKPKVPKVEIPKIDYDEIARRVEKKVGVKDIEGLEQTLSALKTQTSQGYLHGGGVTELFAGSGITLSRDTNGNYTITSTGSGGANVATEGVTATQSGSNVEIDLTQLANPYTTILLVLRNGLVAYPGDTNLGYSQAGDIITVYNADASEQFLIQYTYA